MQAKKLLFSLANESFLIPGQADFPLGGLFSPPENKDQEGIKHPTIISYIFKISAVYLIPSEMWKAAAAAVFICGKLSKASAVHLAH